MPLYPPAGASDAIASPLDIPGCALWLDASQLALADNDPVATWPDLSGNGYDATQATAENRPTFKAGIQNGLGIVRAVGAPDAQALGLSAAGLDLVRDLAAVTVAFAASGTADSHVVIEALDPAGIATRMRAEISTNVLGRLSATDSDSAYVLAEQNISDVAGRFVVALSVLDPIAMVATIEVASANPSVMTNVNPVSQRTPDSASLEVRIMGDAINSFAGDLGELIVWQRALNARERRRVLEYLSAKWGTL